MAFRTKAGLAFFTAVLIAMLAAGCPTNITGDVTVGQNDYTTMCAACHSLGSFDTSGTAGDLAGNSDDIISNLGSIDVAMAGIVLSDQQVADLRAFVASVAP